ncbi:MAG: hypothetical protein ACRD1E_06320 [Terriglobales bacterium]
MKSPADHLRVLAGLQALYGNPAAPRLTDPYKMILRRLSGYPQSEANCDLGFAALRRDIGLEPEEILGAPIAKLAAALRHGGMVPELRARRLHEVARRIIDDYDGNLRTVLRLPLAEAKKRLRSFPTIGESTAEQILLFNRVAPVAALPSNCLHVPLRLGFGLERKSWSSSYREAQATLAAALPGDIPGQIRAYLLFKRHGHELCKLKSPQCARCPLTADCNYPAKAKSPPQP